MIRVLRNVEHQGVLWRIRVIMSTHDRGQLRNATMVVRALKMQGGGGGFDARGQVTWGSP